ncbi:hypothetical protein ACWCXH_33785 [Kitasatospora sp. NPDC001660]
MDDLSVYLPDNSAAASAAVLEEPAGGWSILPPVELAPADPSDAWATVAEALNMPGVPLFYVDGRK